MSQQLSGGFEDVNFGFRCQKWQFNSFVDLALAVPGSPLEPRGVGKLLLQSETIMLDETLQLL